MFCHSFKIILSQKKTYFQRTILVQAVLGDFKQCLQERSDFFVFIRLPKYGAQSYFTSIEKLSKATEEFHKKLNSHLITSYFSTLIKVPVGIKEVKDIVGICFNLVTNEMASSDTRFQGIICHFNSIMTSIFFRLDD